MTTSDPEPTPEPDPERDEKRTWIDHCRNVLHGIEQPPALDATTLMMRKKTT